MRPFASIFFACAISIAGSAVALGGFVLAYPLVPDGAKLQAVLSENPDLEALEKTWPWLVRSTLAEAARSGEVPKGGGPSLDGLDDASISLLQRNPALMQVYQASPDAAAELLALIKAAAGGKPASKGHAP